MNNHKLTLIRNEGFELSTVNEVFFWLDRAGLTESYIVNFPDQVCTNLWNDLNSDNFHSVSPNALSVTFHHSSSYVAGMFKLRFLKWIK